MNTSDTSLRMLICAVLVRMFDKRIEFPERDEMWHLAFWKLKKRKDMPLCIASLTFNWDGPTCVSPAVREILGILLATGCVKMKTPRFICYIDQEMADLWRTEHRGIIAKLEPFLGSVVSTFQQST